MNIARSRAIIHSKLARRDFREHFNAGRVVAAEKTPNKSSFPRAKRREKMSSSLAWRGNDEQ